MMELLCTDDDFEYIDSKAKHVLADLRRPYKFYHIHINERVLWKGRDEYIFETFTSTKITTTLFWMLQVLGVEVRERDSIGRIIFKYEGDMTDLHNRLKHDNWSIYEILNAKKKKKKNSFQNMLSIYHKI